MMETREVFLGAFNHYEGACVLVSGFCVLVSSGRYFMINNEDFSTNRKGKREHLYDSLTHSLTTFAGDFAIDCGVQIPPPF